MLTDRWRRVKTRCSHAFVLMLLQALRRDDRQAGRGGTGRLEGKQTAIGAVRQAVSPGILQEISKLSEEGDK